MARWAARAPDATALGLRERPLEIGVGWIDAGAVRPAEERQPDTRTDVRARVETDLGGDSPRQEALQRLAPRGRAGFGGAEQLGRQLDSGAHKSILAHAGMKCGSDALAADKPPGKVYGEALHGSNAGTPVLRMSLVFLVTNVRP